MANDLKTPGFFIIALLGTIVTAGFFLAFFPTLFKKRIRSPSVMYSLVASDVYGNKTTIPGIRTTFQNKDVALSFAKFYKKKFPLYDFRIINEFDGTERLVIVEHV